jgi:hypothetical protein
MLSMCRIMGAQYVFGCVPVCGAIESPSHHSTLESIHYISICCIVNVTSFLFARIVHFWSCI